MINSILVQRPSRATRKQFHEFIELALERAASSNRNIGVFEDRRGALHIQNLTRNSIQYFGKFGILYATQIETNATNINTNAA